MFKKTMFAVLVALMALALAAPALAAPGNKVIKGEVTVVGASTFTVLTQNGVSVVVMPPAGFDLSLLKVGDMVIVKGRLQPDGTIAAEWVKMTNMDADDDMDNPDEEKDTSVYCSSTQSQPHPVAAKLAEKYGVTVEWIMGYFCQGMGMGQIMLALRTAQVTGGEPDALLAQRSEGKGWGEIWKESKLIGSEKSIQTPPGWLKKDKVKDKNK
ncbi:MAG: DUF5666 domain-containing protein [Anaerolineales bacterium]